MSVVYAFTSHPIAMVFCVINLGLLVLCFQHLSNPHTRTVRGHGPCVPPPSFPLPASTPYRTRWLARLRWLPDGLPGQRHAAWITKNHPSVFDSRACRANPLPPRRGTCRAYVLRPANQCQLWCFIFCYIRNLTLFALRYFGYPNN